MGEAILSRLLSTGTYAPGEVVASHPRSERCTYLESHYGVRVVNRNSDIPPCEILLLAVKPQKFTTIASELASIITDLVLSVMAGVSLSSLGRVFPQLPIVRAMPNTPAQVGAGMTAFACNDLVTAPQKERVKFTLQAVGEVVEVPEEWLNAVTGLAGSGPGYLAVVLEALIDGGVLMGLPRALAQTLAIQTMLGTAQYLKAKHIDPADLKSQVTSPGGTTIAGIYALEYHGLRLALMAAVEAASRRAAELDYSP